MAFSSQSFTAPKISKMNFSSPLSSSAAKISGVTPKLSRSRIKFRARGVSSPIVGAQSSIENTLVETNTILVEIQKQLALDFAMRIAEEKEKNAVLKEERSARKFALKESAVESIKKIGGAIKSTVSKVAAPVKGFFDKLLEFITTLGLGVGANAVFQWLEKKENREKIDKFFKVISANWKLIRNILGVLVAGGLALKITSAALTIGKVLAILASPFAIGILAGAAAIYGIHRASREGYVGGPGFVEAHDLLDASLKTAGITNDGRYEDDPNKELSDAHRKLYKDVILKRTQLYDLKKIQDAEAEKAGQDAGGRGRPLGQGTYSNEMAYEQARGVVLKKYSNEARELVGIPARAMGGPVNAKQPYIVGEKGPEIFAPNVNGSVVNNYRTEKIYDMISSKNAGKINFVNMDLPPIDMRQEKSIPTPPAPEIPQISSTNSADLWRNKTPDIYGIYV